MQVVAAILVLLLLLSVLVLIHEFGHFIMARRFGIKVEEFGFGFPPRAIGMKKGETIYSINWIPIGGFVKLYGEDEAGGGSLNLRHPSSTSNLPDSHRAFFTHPAWQRASIVVAGVVMNVVLAVVVSYIFIALSGFHTEIAVIGDKMTHFAFANNSYEPVVTSVEIGSPAEKAGIKPLTEVNHLNGIPITRGAQELISLVNQQKGKPVLVEGRNLMTNQTVTYTVVPRMNPPKGQGRIGIALEENAVLSYDTVSQKLLSGFSYPIDMMAYNLIILKSLFSQSVATHNFAPITQNIAGPVGIYRIVASFLALPNARVAVLQILNLTILLSTSLAFFNILPIPALDGGRFFFIVIELVTRKKVNPKYEAVIHTVGFFVLIGLVLVVTANDLNNLLGIVK